MIVFVVVSWHSWPVSKTIAKTLEDARIIARRLKWCQTFVRIARDPLADINCLLSDCMDARNRSLWQRKAMFKRSTEWGRVARTSKNRLKLESLNFIFLLFTSVWDSRGTITSKSAADWTLLDRLFVLEYGSFGIRVSWGGWWHTSYDNNWNLGRICIFDLFPFTDTYMYICSADVYWFMENIWALAMEKLLRIVCQMLYKTLWNLISADTKHNWHDSTDKIWNQPRNVCGNSKIFVRILIRDEWREMMITITCKHNS